MSNKERPAVSIGGDTTTPIDGRTVAEIPAKLRVHALAKLLNAESKQIIAALTEIGEIVRSAQSSISRDTALRVVNVLRPGSVPEAEEQTAVGRSASAPPVDPPPTRRAAGREVPNPEFNPVPVAPLFATPPIPSAAPLAMFIAPEPSAKRPRAEEPLEDSPVVAEKAERTTEKAPAEKSGRAGSSPEREKSGRRSRQERVEDVEEQADVEDDDDTDEAGNRRRRRRGRRGRGRGRGGAFDGDGGEDTPADEQQDTQETETRAEEDDQAVSAATRRRRRRRRRGGGEDEPASRADDPPNTVVHVRESRDLPPVSSDDEVRSVKGSTRLEAKRQRRRDGREAGRRRPPILSEAEFLARREAVDRVMVVREHDDRIQMAVLEDSVLVEHFVTASGSGSLVGNVYLGRVQNVLPSMEAAFVDIGRGRNAVLYAGEVDWDAAGLEGKARKIEQALSTGDSVLVQVTKDPVGHKGARLTTQISLPGRFLVYVPGGGATGISRKLPDTERKRLKDVLKRIVPEDAGVIIRTASEGISEQALDSDVSRLKAQWEIIKRRADGTDGQPKASAPHLLYEEPDLLIKVIRDLFTEDFSGLVVQGALAYDTIKGYVTHVAPDLAGRLRRHVKNNDVFAEYRIDEQLLKALDRKVWLPSGGYLVIDRTEAMTVIDVNTGKFTGSGGNLEETVTRNNLEAAEEIIRQLRLRDIGGIIVIDFIDMVLESNRDLVLRRLTECLGRDRTRHQVAEVTSLGLVQMTRKRVGTGLLEAYSTSCEHCRGRGLLVSTEPVAIAAMAPSAGQSPVRPSAAVSTSQSFANGSTPSAPPANDGQGPAAGSANARTGGGREHGTGRERRRARRNGADRRAETTEAAVEPTRNGVVTPPVDEPKPIEKTPVAAEAVVESRTTVSVLSGTRRRRAASRPAGPPQAADGA